MKYTCGRPPAYASDTYSVYLSYMASAQVVGRYYTKYVRW